MGASAAAEGLAAFLSIAPLAIARGDFSSFRYSNKTCKNIAKQRVCQQIVGGPSRGLILGTFKVLDTCFLKHTLMPTLAQFTHLAAYCQSKQKKMGYDDQN